MKTFDEISFLEAKNILNIIFFTKNYDLNRASYRIWIHCFSNSLKAIGANAKICTIEDKAFPEANVIIFDKGISKELIEKIRLNFKKDTLTGAINPPADSLLPVDFVIVGSREEECTLSNYPHVIIVPVIDPTIHVLPLKNHVDDKTIKLCYHGNDFHLSSFQSSGLKKALERYQDEQLAFNRKIVLTVISTGNPRWLIGKPDIAIKYVKFNWETFPQLLSEQDIGIVPNCYYKKPLKRMPYFYKRVLNMEIEKTDIIIRMKNKSNFGRLLIFMQAGIPTVADLTPSHLQLLGDTRNGFCASNEEGWLKAFRILSAASERNEIAKNAKSFVTSEYEPLDWAKQFMMEFYNFYFGKNKKSLHQTTQSMNKQEFLAAKHIYQP